MAMPRQFLMVLKDRSITLRPLYFWVSKPTRCAIRFLGVLQLGQDGVELNVYRDTAMTTGALICDARV